MTKFLSLTQARKDLFKLSEEVQHPSTYITLTLEGQPKVVMMSSEEFDSIMETMEILSDPQALQNIREAEADFEKGNFVSWEDAKKELFPENTGKRQSFQKKRK